MLAMRFVGVVLASRGYPASAESGGRSGLDAPPRFPASLVFHAGTKLGTRGRTAGGRVLTVSARAAVRRRNATAYARRGDDFVRRHAVPPRHRQESELAGEETYGGPMIQVLILMGSDSTRRSCRRRVTR